jgi:succinoglycan biosynthesis transport protein ExoP
MQIRPFLAAVKTRFLLVSFTLLISVVTGAVLTQMEPRRYVASTDLVLNFEEDTPFDSAAIPAPLSSSYLATQLDIIRSRKVALKVVELLDRENSPAARNADLQSGSDVSIESDVWTEGAWRAAELIDNLQVEPLPNSRVVTLSYEAFDPSEAAKTANAYAQAFIATTLELTLGPARRNAAWFDEQLKVLRKRLESARARLTQFQLDKGIVALDEKLGAESTRLDDLSKNLVEAQMATSDARSRQLGVNHPEYRAAVQREYALRQSLDAQKRRFLEIKGQRDELDALAREVEVEQQNYGATLQNYYKTMMESQFNQTNIAVLSPAVPPQTPSAPNVALNMMSATVLGLILGLVVAVSAEMLNPRVRSIRDVA